MEGKLGQSGIKILRSASGNADKVQLPDGTIVDIIVGGTPQGGGNGFAWQVEGQGGSGQGASYGTSTGGMGGAFGDSIRARIQELMRPSDPMGSPVYQGAMRAYDQSQQRGTDRTRNAIAERMAASGQAHSGAMDSQIGAAEQAAGEASANFAGNLGIRALEGQRDQIMQALQMGAGLMTDEQRLALTEKLGLINANLQQQGITNQSDQFNSSLGWDMARFGYGANTQPWNMATGR
jgi:hypothetical protein